MAQPSAVAEQLCDLDTAYAGTERLRHKHGDGQFTDALYDFGFGVHRRHLGLEIRHGSDKLWSLKMQRHLVILVILFWDSFSCNS